MTATRGFLRTRRARHVLLIAAALATLSILRPTAQTLREDLRAQVEAEVMAAEKTLETATEQRNLDAMGRLLSDDLLDSNQWGATLDKDGFLNWLKTTGTLPKITMQDTRVMYFADVAVISGGKLAVRPQVSQRMLFTNVWIKKGGAWQLFLHTQFWDPRAQTPLGNPSPGRAPSKLEDPSVESAIRAAEDGYRQARLAHDPVALARVIHQVGQETIQTGVTRDKAATVAYYQSAPLTELTTSNVTYHGMRDLVVVAGRQTEVGRGTEHLVFRRVWIETDGDWQLLASVQFRDPAMNGLPSLG
jgi:hypothetical protein